MNNRIDAIYARQSVDKKDSISIESQIESCKYELKGGNCKEYKDNGCYLYQGRDMKLDKAQSLKDQMLVLAPHEGIVPSDIWLTCRKKLMNNMKIQSARKATHTWLAGKIKCGNCGYALMRIFNSSGRQYLRCTKRLDNKSCPGCGKIITAELEAVVYQQMVKKLGSYKTLTGISAPSGRYLCSPS